eukprot:3662146-Rhodomonas_salina.2
MITVARPRQAAAVPRCAPGPRARAGPGQPRFPGRFRSDDHTDTHESGCGWGPGSSHSESA